jgi:hypothetical protein
VTTIFRAGESGVALRLPPQSKMVPEPSRSSLPTTQFALWQAVRQTPNKWLARFYEPAYRSRMNPKAPTPLSSLSQTNLEPNIC